MTLPDNYPDDDYPHPRVTRIVQTDGTTYLIPWDEVAALVTGPNPNPAPGADHDTIRDALIEGFTRLIVGDETYDQIQQNIDAYKGYIQPVATLGQVGAVTFLGQDRHAEQTT